VCPHVLSKRISKHRCSMRVNCLKTVIDSNRKATAAALST
jgi:hypothetical protein